MVFDRPDSGKRGTPLDRFAAAWLLLLGMAVFASTVYGVVHYFSPLPYSDQWLGALGFLRQLAEGDYWAWWDQHMEHRIVLARTLFWIDANWFGGRNVFLLAAGLILQALTATVFVYQATRGRRAGSMAVICGVSLVFLFSWIQFENFTWAFQSQFIAVYLFAVVAFSVFSRVSGVYWSLVPAVIATVSMGNGLFVFALLAFQAVLLRRSLKQLAVPIVGGALVGAIYMYGFSRPDIGLPVVSFNEAVWLVPQFFLAFMGSAAYFLVQNYLFATLFGLLSFAAMSVMTIQLYVRNDITPYRSFLITGYAFVVAAAMAAAASRYPLGMGQAVVSRYGTPMFISWLCLFLLAYDSLAKPLARNMVLSLVAVLATWVAAFQHNVNNDTPELLRRDLAVLSMKIGVDRPDLVPAIFFADQRAYLLEMARHAADTGFGPYASGWLHDAGMVKYDPAKVDDVLCTGSFDMVRRLPTGIEASGWVVLKEQEPHRDRVLVLLTDASSATVGYGVSGAVREDVDTFYGYGRHTGWAALVYPGTVPTQAYAYTNGKFCKLPLGSGMTGTAAR